MLKRWSHRLRTRATVLKPLHSANRSRRSRAVREESSQRENLGLQRRVFTNELLSVVTTAPVTITVISSLSRQASSIRARLTTRRLGRSRKAGPSHVEGCSPVPIWGRDCLAGPLTLGRASRRAVVSDNRTADVERRQGSASPGRMLASLAGRTKASAPTQTLSWPEPAERSRR